MESDFVPPILKQRCEQLAEISINSGVSEPLNSIGIPKLGVECLLDTFVALYDECKLDHLAKNKNVAAFLKKCQ